MLNQKPKYFFRQEEIVGKIAIEDEVVKKNPDGTIKVNSGELGVREFEDRFLDLLPDATE